MVDNHPVTQGIGPSSPERDSIFDEACLGKFPLPRSYSEFVQQLNPPNDGRPFSIIVCPGGYAYFNANNPKEYATVRAFVAETIGLLDGGGNPRLCRCAVISGDYPESPQESSQLEG